MATHLDFEVRFHAKTPSSRKKAVGEPMSILVLGDFSRRSGQDQGRLGERHLLPVDVDNFDDVIASVKPHLAFSVENKLSPESGTKLAIDLSFESLDDFSPEAVAKRVGPLKELLDLRTRLSDLRGSLQGNDKLEELLLEAVGNTEKLGKLKDEIGTEESNA